MQTTNLQRQFRIFIVFAINFIFTLFAQSNWETIDIPSFAGLNNISKSQDKIIASTKYGGVYISEDLMESWNFLGLKGCYIESSIITAENELLVAFIEKIGKYIPGNENKLLIYNFTTKKWRTVKTGVHCRSLKIDSQGVIYAGTINDGVFVSKDNGNSWENIGQNGYLIRSMFLDKNDNLIVAGSGTSLVMLANKGNEWINLGSYYTNYMDVTKTLDGVIYTIISEKPGVVSYIYKSVDEGKTWENITGNISNILAWKLMSVGNDVYVGTQNGGVFKYKQCGYWQEISYGATSSDITDLKLLDSEHIMAGTLWEGIVKININDGSIEYKNKGFTGGMVHTVIPLDDSNIILGYLSGIYKLNILTGQYSGMNKYLAGSNISNIIMAPDNTIWAATYAGGLSKFNIISNSWIPLCKNSTEIGINDLIRDGDKVYMSMRSGSSGSFNSPAIFYTSDLGSSWNKIIGSNPKNLFIDSKSNLLGYDGQCIFKINDSNKMEIMFIAYYNTFWTMTETPSGNIIAGNSQGEIIQSSDYYQTHQKDQITDGEAYGKNGITHLHYHKGVIYCFAQTGELFTSRDNGHEFIKDNSFPEIIVKGHFYLNDDLYFFSDNEILKLNINTTHIDNSESILQEFYLEQNYPNPFNPTTSIKYRIKENGFVSIIVYDILGTEVKTLVKEYKNKGNYKVDFKADNLSSGIYIYKMKINNFISTKKMVLTK